METLISFEIQVKSADIEKEIILSAINDYDAKWRRVKTAMQSSKRT